VLTFMGVLLEGDPEILMLRSVESPNAQSPKSSGAADKVTMDDGPLS
jgi:hypothetical protein